jgi:hypothetical protein
MKIYLASTAPGNEAQRERGTLPIRLRLLSYYHIWKKGFDEYKVFSAIKRLKGE